MENVRPFGDSFWSGPPSCPCFQPGDYHQGYFKTVENVESIEKCQLECQQEWQQCGTFTYHTMNKKCWLKGIRGNYRTLSKYHLTGPPVCP